MEKTIMALIEKQTEVAVGATRQRLCFNQVMAGCLGLAIVLMTAGPAGAVELNHSPQLWKEIDAFPRVVGTDPVAHRINQILQRSDERLGRAVRDCAKTSSHPRDLAGAWKRSVRVTANGPAFLSLVADDVSFCGDAHPNSGSLALVFDLHTGQLVDWRALLPAKLVQSTPQDESLDGGKVGLISSDELSRSYRALYPAQPQDGIPKEDWATCHEAVGESRAFLVWPAAKPNGLALQPADLPHVVAGCGVPVVIPSATLRSLGVSQLLTDALDASQ